jgi:hypothetical protein
MRRQLFLVISLSLMITAMGIGYIHFGQSDLGMVQNQAFKWGVSLGDQLIYSVNSTLNGAPINSNLAFVVSGNGTTNIGPFYYDYLNLTQYIYDPASNSFMNSPDNAGIYYSTNTSSNPSYPFWCINDMNQSDYIMFYASMVVPLNVSNSALDLNYWGNVMTNLTTSIKQFGTYGCQLNLTQYYVNSNELDLFNSTTGYYCNMTFNANGTLQSAVFKELLWLGDWYNVTQIYTRLSDINALNPVYNTSFQYPSGSGSLYYRNYNESTFVCYTAFGQFSEAITQADYMGPLWVRQVNATYTQYDPSSATWIPAVGQPAIQSVPIGQANDWRGNIPIQGGVQPINMLYSAGTTGQDIQNNFAYVFQTYVGMDLSFTTSNSCKFENSSTGSFLYVEVNPQGQVYNLTFNGPEFGGYLTNEILYGTSLNFPATPTLSITSSNPSPTGNISLAWNSVPYAENYIVYRYNSIITELNSSLTLVANITGVTINDNSLPNGVYYYVVMAENATGNSTISNCEKVTVLIPSTSTSTTTTTSSTTTPPSFSIAGYSVIAFMVCICVTTLFLDRRLRNKFK